MSVLVQYFLRLIGQQKGIRYYQGCAAQVTRGGCQVPVESKMACIDMALWWLAKAKVPAKVTQPWGPLMQMQSCSTELLDNADLIVRSEPGNPAIFSSAFHVTSSEPRTCTPLHRPTLGGRRCFVNVTKLYLTMCQILLFLFFLFHLITLLYCMSNACRVGHPPEAEIALEEPFHDYISQTLKSVRS